MSRIPSDEPRIDVDVKDSKPGADVSTVVHLDKNRRSHGPACESMVLTIGCELPTGRAEVLFASSAHAHRRASCGSASNP
jgi:hypothetical protein